MKASHISTTDRIALLGSSRGLGWASYQALVKKYPDANYFVSSRKIAARTNEISKKTIVVPQDFSKVPVNVDFFERLKKFNPTIIIYFAGGGPHGLFAEKKWSDHQWAITTNFLYPAELIHGLFRVKSELTDLQQIVVIGSAIAEDRADPSAATYAAAKHALKGLISSVQLESSEKPYLRLFSPGYMQTDLLPASSKPRKMGLAEDPQEVAKKLIAFIEKND